jgi:hypothetical protein
MKLSIPLLLFLLLPLLPAQARAASPWAEWNELYAAIRDLRIDPEPARARAALLMPEMRRAGWGGGSTAKTFPLAGYGPECGEQGRNYHLGRFDFFDNRKRQGRHPAHDLFIQDLDQDFRDDRTGEAVSVLAFSAGVVAATYVGWTEESGLYGGNYVWVFDPRTDRFAYYAHLDRVDVRPGQRVAAGTVLGVVGRTGKNAFPPRSPTHLHFMVISWDGGRMTPINPWSELVSAQTR